MWSIKRLLFAAAAIGLFCTSVHAEQVCVEEAGGVCLKYRTVAPAKPAAPKPAAPRAPAAPAFSNSPEAQAEKGLNLSRNEYRLVQSGLQQSGHYNGALDGVMGGGSRKALAAWQAANGAAATGYLTFQQVLALQGHKTPASEPSTLATSPAPENGSEPVSEHPIAGRTYQERLSVNVGSGVFGDIFVELVRDGEDIGLMTIRYVDAAQPAFNFSEDCAISISEAFSCGVRTRRLGSWRATGTLPQVTLSGPPFTKSISFW